MESLKLIPSAFFDVIARLIPGAVAIVACLGFSSDTWSAVVGRYLGHSFEQQEALLVSTGLFFFAAYVVGHLLSPFAKLVQRIGEWEHFAPKPKAPSGAYDWLRVNNKEAGSQCTKIRAEFTMHNGLTVVFFASTGAYLWARWLQWDRPVLAGLLIATMTVAIRGRTTRDTFNETVKKLADASGFPKETVADPSRRC